MSSFAPRRRVAAPAETPPGSIPHFDGYPYIVVRIGRTSLRHIALVPTDWPRERIVELTQAQARANRLDSAACFGPDDAVYVSADDFQLTIGGIPTGLPIFDRLHLAEPIPDSPELAARQADLREYADEYRGHGYLVGDGLEDGAPATPETRAQLGRIGLDGLPSGLRRCARCGQASGQCLSEATDQVVWCHCACDNRSRCARCERPLAAHRLSAWHWDDATGQPWYLAAYAGLSHQCPDEVLRGHRTVPD